MKAHDGVCDSQCSKTESQDCDVAQKRTVKASAYIDVGRLVIPLQFKKVTFVLGPDEISTIHPNVVMSVVSWPLTKDEKLKSKKQVQTQKKHRQPLPAIGSNSRTTRKSNL